MKPTDGLHHVTAIASDPQANVDFYVGVLGQRLVKTTVNFDDPGAYHFYYGDEVGSPGTILTFFPWPNMRRGRRGNGEASAVAYAVPTGSIGYWAERLESLGVSVQRVDRRFGAEVLHLRDPDGMNVKLVETDNSATSRYWSGQDVPQQYAIRGFHGVTLQLDEVAPTADLLIEQLGYGFVGREDNRYRYGAPREEAGHIDLVEVPGQSRPVFGAGSIHHIAFRTNDDDDQAAYRNALLESGRQVTPVKDRQYFRSIYFREPGGVLFEIATDGPGFTTDEPVGHLGEALRLPPWLEGQRDRIERRLPPFERRHSNRRKTSP